MGVAVRRTAFAAAPQSYCNGRRPHPSPPPQAGERTQSPQPLSGCLKQTKGQAVRPVKVIANIIVALIIPIAVVRIGVYLYARQADMHYTVPDSLIGQPLAAAETVIGIKFAVRESGKGLAAFPSKNHPSGFGTGCLSFSTTRATSPPLPTKSSLNVAAPPGFPKKSTPTATAPTPVSKSGRWQEICNRPLVLQDTRAFRQPETSPSSTPT